jgi:hypothetical protein
MKILLESLERPTLMVLIEEDYIGMSKPLAHIARRNTTPCSQPRGLTLWIRPSEMLAEQLDGRNLGKNHLEVVDFAPDRADCIFN